MTSVSAVIRNNSLSSPVEEKAQNIELPEERKQQEKVSKEAPFLPPLNIPENDPSENFDWGESQTPGADEHMKLSPLDENAFDSPTNSMGEAQLAAELGRKSSEERQVKHPQQSNKEVAQLEEHLKSLIQQKDIILKNPPSVEQEQAVTSLVYQIFNIQQQLKQHLQGQPILPPSFLHQPMSSLPNLSNPPILKSNLQQVATNLFLNSVVPIPNFPLLPPQHMQQQQQHTSLPTGFSNDIKVNDDYLVKFQQLEAINRCLQTPSGLLDDQQIRDLQGYKGFLENQLHQENVRKEQFGLLLHQQQQHNAEFQPNQPTSVSFPMPTASVPTNQELSKLMDSRESFVQKTESELSSTDFLNEYNRETEQLGKQMIASTTPSASSDNVSQTVKSNENTPSKGKPPLPKSSESISQKGFNIPSYRVMCIESKADWMARELYNLQHPTLQHPKARFFSGLVAEFEQSFVPSLTKACQLGELLIHAGDTRYFREAFMKLDVNPVFLIMRHRLIDGTWMVGGIVQVMSKLQPYRNASSSSTFKHMCGARIVSSAMASDLSWLRPDKERELRQEIAYDYIDFVISKLKEGKTTTVFRFHEKRLQSVGILQFPFVLYTSLSIIFKTCNTNSILHKHFRR